MISEKDIKNILENVVIMGQIAVIFTYNDKTQTVECNILNPFSGCGCGEKLNNETGENQ